MHRDGLIVAIPVVVREYGQRCRSDAGGRFRGGASVTDSLSGRDLALRLGAVQEAQRLGSHLVGTEHLLIATMTDPLVRRTFLSLGIELRHVQSVVTDLSGRREAGSGGSRRGSELTPEAAEAIERLRRTVPDFAFATRGPARPLRGPARAPDHAVHRAVRHRGPHGARRAHHRSQPPGPHAGGRAERPAPAHVVRRPTDRLAWRPPGRDGVASRTRGRHVALGSADQPPGAASRDHRA